MNDFRINCEIFTTELDSRSLSLRRTIVETMIAADRGHLASALSLVEILRVLYDDVLRYRPREPEWPLRDRFVLSKGHGCLALYAILAEKGFFPRAELERFCQPGGLLGGHPEHKIPGVEISTGSLGHGLPVAVGIALNGKLQKAEYRTFVLLGDGECNEGSVWEAALCAGKHHLENLCVLIDSNRQQSYGEIQEVLPLEPLAAKWQSFGFATAEVNGHSLPALQEVLSNLPLKPNKPGTIICHTIKGKGISFVENNLNWHHKNRLTSEEIRSLLAELGADGCGKPVCE